MTASGTVTDGNSGNNYSYTFVTNTAGVIDIRSITVTAVTSTKTYDGTTSSGGVPTYSLQSGDATTTAPTQTFNNRNAGTSKTLTASGLIINDGNGGNNYSISYATNSTGVINVKSITVTAVTDTKTYDGTASSVGVPAYPALQTGDATGTAPTQTFDSKNVGTNKTLTPAGLVINDGNSGNNYNITYTTNGTGVIGARALIVTAGTNGKTYDGTASASTIPAVTSGTVQTGDAASFTEAYTNKNAGAGKTLTPSGTVTDGNSGNNYSYTFVNNTTGSISALPLTITAAAVSKTYDGTISSVTAPTITSGAVQSGDGANFTETFDTKNAGTSKTLTPSGTITDGNSGNNYAYTFVTANTGTITIRTINVTAVANSKTYDTTTGSSGVPTYTLQTGDAVTTAPIQTFTNKNVGTGKTLTPGGLVINDGNSGNNYTIGYITANTGTITARTLTVTAATNTKTYDGSTGAAAIPTVTSGAIQTGDAANFTESYSTNAAGTNKTIVPAGTVTDGNSGSNYSYTFVNNTTGIINAAPFAKLQILLPGETAAPGTSTGKTGTPTAVNSATALTATVNAVDSGWNVVSTATDSIHITSTDAYATMPANGKLASGTKTFSVTLITAPSQTITATDITDGTKTANTSASITINPVTRVTTSNRRKLECSIYMELVE